MASVKQTLKAFNSQQEIQLRQMFSAVLVDLANAKTIFDAHTHNGDGSEAGSYYTSPPRSNAADVTAGTASTFTTTLTS